jgi:hypothetical protein
MLSNVLEDYFSSIKDERDFDFPLMSLLAAMGFYDIHLTHGSREIGKDFIAKKREDGVEVEYAFQSKKGDINQKKCSEEVLPQLLLASVSGLSHPQFDKTLPRRVFLVSTGLLIGNAPLILQDFNDTLRNDYGREPVTFWGKNQLVTLFQEYGLTAIHQVSAAGMKGLAEFYSLYSKALERKLSDNEIETFSQLWLDPSLEYRKRILRASIEADLFAVRLRDNGSLYEVITVYLALARAVMDATYETDDDYLVNVYRQIVDENIIPLCKEFHAEVKIQLEANDKQLIALAGNQSRTLPMLHYLVWCSRILAITSLHFFISSDREEQDSLVAFMKDLIEAEPGCGHPPSDRYATALVWTTLALIKANDLPAAIELVKRATVWLCDRTEQGVGLASYDATEYEETAMLVGYAYSSVKVQKNVSSFLATVLADLAAFTDDKDLYSVVVNDVAACEIVYEYWQFPDTKAIFTILSEDSRTYPNTVHEPTLTAFEDYRYAQHIGEEPSTFRITERVGLAGLILLSVLLRDRYFPKVWRQLVD